MANKYRVYSRNGVLIAEGASHECAEVLGICVKSFRNAFSRKVYNKYRIEDITERKEKLVTTSVSDVVRAWDEVCEPIRKKYGVKVKSFVYDEKGNAHEKTADDGRP